MAEQISVKKGITYLAILSVGILAIIIILWSVGLTTATFNQATATQINAPLSWNANTSYLFNIEAESCGNMGNNIYCVGGINSIGLSNKVEIAPINSNSIGTWTASLPYVSNILYTTCTNETNSGYVYCIGGKNTAVGQGTNTVFGAFVTGGTLGEWIDISNGPYPVSLFSSACTYYQNFIYCIGGMSSPSPTYNSVYSANVMGGGYDLGNWIAQTPYPSNVEETACNAYSGYLYCVAGDNGISPYLNNVYSAPISGGTVGSWTEENNYPIAITDIGGPECQITNGILYCVGGETSPGTGTADIYEATVSGGTVGTWVQETSYPIPIYYNSCITYGGAIYCIAGRGASSAISNIYAAFLNTVLLPVSEGAANSLNSIIPIFEIIFIVLALEILMRMFGGSFGDFFIKGR